MSDGERASRVIYLMQDGKRRPAALVDCVPLSVANRPADVALPQRPTRTRREDEVLRPGKACAELVADQIHRELARERYRPR